jgi:iron complex outermembrane receptor protein
MRGRVHIRENIMKKSIIASAVALAFASPSYSAEDINLDEVTVKANRFESKESETTYASEVHTEAHIKASGATTLYDFLAQQTSLNVTPNIGNRATPAINLRGFGTENGYQNVVITVDGQRLNNIDLQPALLAGIPLGNIERIEISKGAGSVIYGDGATAGAIQIYTKNKTGVSVTASLGNFGQQNHSISAGISEQYIDLSASLAHDDYDGFSKKDTTGHKDQFDGETQNVKLKIKPTDTLRFIAEGTSTRNAIRYVNPLTHAEFKDDPRGNSGSVYTQQSFDSDQWRLGAEYDVTPNIKMSAFHFQDDKFSEFISATPSTANSIYKSNDFSIRYQDEMLRLIAGYQGFDGERKSFTNFGVITTDNTSKKNEALYVQGEINLVDWTFSAGARDERVRYNFKPVINPFATAAAKQKQDIDAWDIGANYRFNPILSAFVNYNQAYQAPDIDRLFSFGGGFNGFIDPAKVKTLNIGLNHTIENNRLKVTAFHADLNDEIYLVPGIFKNTNLNKSHKYGLEIQDFFQLNNELSASIIYNYTRAKIDREDDGGGAFNDSNLPGVPKHTAVANLNYKFIEGANLNINHTWRSEAYAFNDFENNFTRKQDSYNSTNIALNYQYKNYNFFASISNLFEQENSVRVADDAIYPVDFVRTWRVGMKADF